MKTDATILGSKRMKPMAGDRRAFRSALALAVTMGLLTPGAALAADPISYWDNGSGVWNAGNVNWTREDGSTGAWIPGVAVFRTAAAGDSVTVDGAQTFTGLEFRSNGNGYRLLGGGAGELAIGAPRATIVVDASTQATIDATISGAGGLTVSGAGTLLLSGQGNTYSGGTTVGNSAVLAISATGALGSGSLSALDLSEIRFQGTANAGARDITLVNGFSLGRTSLRFVDQASAGNANIVIDNRVNLEDRFGVVGFEGESSAGNARISSVWGGSVNFSDRSNAGRSVIDLPQQSVLTFMGSADAGQATVVTRGAVVFRDNARADGLSLTAMGGRFGPALQLSDMRIPLSIGSLWTENRVVLGDGSLTLGLLGRDDQVGELHGGGTVLKVGAGTLSILRDDDQYFQGTTDVREGRLLLKSMSHGGTTVIRAAGSLVGSGGVRDLINEGTVAPGGPIRVLGNYVQRPGGLLAIDISP
ncbi:MAG: autotransporter-associated beta strand repeat-containing protein, partial [Lysobacter sp.]|nr:autotransporter-associated beta strand repeat-containing protein [Lysobacter sp.]